MSFFFFYCSEMLCFSVFLRTISNFELMEHSYLWLLHKMDDTYYQSEMEVASIVTRWLTIHGDSLKPDTIDTIVKCVRVTSLKEYYITQILPSCEFFNMSKEKIAAVLEYQKNGTESPALPEEWCLTPDYIYQPVCQMVTVLDWTSNDTLKLDFFKKKHPGSIDAPPTFINFLGVIMEPILTFQPPNIIVDVTAVFNRINVEKINCEFSCFFRKGDRERKYSGLFSESTVSLSYNIVEWTDHNPFTYFDYMKEMRVLFFVKRFDV